MGIGSSREDGERGGWERLGWRECGDDHSSSQCQDLYGGHDGGIGIAFAIFSSSSSGGGDRGDSDDDSDNNDNAYEAIVCRSIIQRMSKEISKG